MLRRHFEKKTRKLRNLSSSGNQTFESKSQTQRLAIQREHMKSSAPRTFEIEVETWEREFLCYKNSIVRGCIFPLDSHVCTNIDKQAETEWASWSIVRQLYIIRRKRIWSEIWQNTKQPQRRRRQNTRDRTR